MDLSHCNKSLTGKKKKKNVNDKILIKFSGFIYQLINEFYNASEFFSGHLILPYFMFKDVR